jgi:hypothetical protein
LPSINGDAFVLGAAPDPVIPEELLHHATFVTANASQIYLERFGIARPHITLMRSNMDDGEATSVAKLKSLAGRRTGLLVLFPRRTDPTCAIQRELLDAVGYGYDDCLVMHRLDAGSVHSRVLNPAMPHLHIRIEPSMGLRAVLHGLAAGVSRVAVAGVSFRSSGCSYLDLAYERIHVEGDREIFGRIRQLGLPVFPTDSAPDRANQRRAVAEDCEAHGLQARSGRRKDMAAPEGCEPVAIGHRRRQVHRRGAAKDTENHAA